VIEMILLGAGFANFVFIVSLFVFGLTGDPLEDGTVNEEGKWWQKKYEGL